MLTKAFILLCAVAAVLAYPSPQNPPQKPVINIPTPKPYLPQIQLQGGGGGSRKQGFDVSIDGRAPVWQSGNGRHQLDVTGGYSQHLGGPYGNSPADKRFGAGYTFRF